MRKKLEQKKNVRDTVFPGNIKLQDLLNPRYISRKPLYDFLREEAKEIRGAMLDFGCGNMQYKSLFVGKVTKYDGLDVATADEYGLHADNITYYDGVKIPFADEAYDVVMAIEVFEHVEEIETVLKEVNRILKKSGKLIATMPMTFSLHMKPYDFRRFTRYGLEKYLKSAGFTNIDIKPSTSAEHTIRRMKICNWETRRPRLLEWRIFKCYVFYANLRFILSKNRISGISLPIDWMVKCEKESYILKS